MRRKLKKKRPSETRKRVDDDGEPQTSSKARRTSYDTMVFLQQKLEVDKDLKFQQIEEQRQERAERQHKLQDFQSSMLEQQKQSNDILKTFQQQLQQQSQQQGLLQQQMMSVMNQQQQLFMKIFTQDKK